MNAIPAKVKSRFSEGLKRYKPILTRAEKQDLNESDTVTIITDMLSDIFGYDKYTEITSEFAIKKTFCDLAIRIDDEIKLLIEAKSIGTNLKDAHLKQATDYGVNAGIIEEYERQKRLEEEAAKESDSVYVNDERAYEASTETEIISGLEVEIIDEETPREDSEV